MSVQIIYTIYIIPIHYETQYVVVGGRNHNNNQWNIKAYHIFQAQLPAAAILASEN